MADLFARLLATIAAAAVLAWALHNWQVIAWITAGAVGLFVALLVVGMVLARPKVTSQPNGPSGGTAG